MGFFLIFIYSIRLGNEYARHLSITCTEGNSAISILKQIDNIQMTTKKGTLPHGEDTEIPPIFAKVAFTAISKHLLDIGTAEISNLPSELLAKFLWNIAEIGNK